MSGRALSRLACCYLDTHSSLETPACVGPSPRSLPPLPRMELARQDQRADFLTWGHAYRFLKNVRLRCLPRVSPVPEQSLRGLTLPETLPGWAWSSRLCLERCPQTLVETLGLGAVLMAVLPLCLACVLSRVHLVLWATR